jgi:hypothetical protein
LNEQILITFDFIVSVSFSSVTLALRVSPDEFKWFSLHESNTTFNFDKQRQIYIVVHSRILAQQKKAKEEKDASM